MSDNLEKLAQQVLRDCEKNGLMLVTAESCTGGLIAGALTAIAGSSSVVERGFVTYTNKAKHEMLGVPLDLFESVGAVSEEVARAMAEGALKHSRAQVAVSVTGIAGPSGATEDKPVGLVHLAASRKGEATIHERHIFDGDRTNVRQQAVSAALSLILKLVSV